MVNYSYKQLKAEKELRHLEYYREMEAIEKGLSKPNPAARGCRYSNVNSSQRRLRLVQPQLKSAL